MRVHTLSFIYIHVCAYVIREKDGISIYIQVCVCMGVCERKRVCMI